MMTMQKQIIYREWLIVYLLPRVDVCIDVFEDGFEHGVITDTQIMDLYLSMLRPVFRYL